VILVDGLRELDNVVQREASEHRVGVLLPSDWTLETGAPATVLPWGNWSEPESMARDLYGQMRALDELGVEIIVCPLPPPEGMGLAIRDRLRKATK
jgi:L-threonylcarbamoyladenylate synthase